ncbi:YoaK family protein [Plantactinospora sp. CA-290183]|uniref:YoaK family protein n=1 Tax=Plantactinospora sp. CA-290183 TaxID=3240006 RepID=UPI003D8AD2BA
MDPGDPRTGAADRRRRDIYVIILAVFSGAIDAFGFLGLGGSFTSVMTGNMVLLGAAAAGWETALAGHVLTAIVGYVAGTFVGARIAGEHVATDPVWPPRVTAALAVELGLFLATGIVWLVTGAAPTAAVQLALLATSAAGLGIQSAAIGRFGVAGLSTTYLTGTLTTLVTGLAARRPIGALRRPAFILLGLVAGAGVGALLLTHVRLLAPLVPSVLLATVVLGAVFTMRDRSGARARSPRDAGEP